MAEPEINVDHLELLENVNQIGKVDSIFDEIAVNLWIILLLNRPL